MWKPVSTETIWFLFKLLSRVRWHVTLVAFVCAIILAVLRICRGQVLTASLVGSCHTVPPTHLHKAHNSPGGPGHLYNTYLSLQNLSTHWHLNAQQCLLNMLAEQVLRWKVRHYVLVVYMTKPEVMAWPCVSPPAAQLQSVSRLQTIVPVDYHPNMSKPCTGYHSFHIGLRYLLQIRLELQPHAPGRTDIPNHTSCEASYSAIYIYSCPSLCPFSESWAQASQEPVQTCSILPRRSC